MGIETTIGDVRLSRYGQASVTPSPVNRMMADFDVDFRDGVDVNLGVGYVNERTIPVERFQEALNAIIADPVRYRQAFNYGGPAGTASLIASLREFIARQGLDRDTLAQQRLIVGPCGATSVLESLAEVMEPGIVVTSDPMYYIYCETLERKGFEVLAVPEDEEGIGREALDRRLAELGDRIGELAFFYTVTVNNPSCTLLSNRRRRALRRVAAECTERLGRKVPVFFDLAYELLLHDPQAEPFASVLPEDDLGIVYEVGTLSKLLAPALRIGYLLGPDGELMDAMVQKTSDAGFSAPVFAQEMASWLLDNCLEEQLRRVNAGYREKAVAVSQRIDDRLGPYLEERRGGRAGFYFYLTLADVETHTQSPLFRRLTRQTGDPAIDGPAHQRRPRVIYIPGEYCVHPRGELIERGRRQLRLSYGYESTETILRALDLVRDELEVVAGPPR